MNTWHQTYNSYYRLILMAGILIILARSDAVVASPHERWNEIITEARARLGPVLPTQTCVDYAQETEKICREKGAFCTRITFACSITGHSVVIARASEREDELCTILDAVNRETFDHHYFSCAELNDGFIPLTGEYCEGKARCRCKILSPEQVVKDSEPSASAAIYRPNLWRNLFGARQKCEDSCKERFREHRESADLITAGCTGTMVISTSTEEWGISSWLTHMSVPERCSYATQYFTEAVHFYERCVDSCVTTRWIQ